MKFTKLVLLIAIILALVCHTEALRRRSMRRKREIEKIEKNIIEGLENLLKTIQSNMPLCTLNENEKKGITDGWNKIFDKYRNHKPNQKDPLSKYSESPEILFARIHEEYEKQNLMITNKIYLNNIQRNTPTTEDCSSIRLMLKAPESIKVIQE